MSSLYDLTAEYIQLMELAEDPETDPEVLSDTMEGLSGEIEDKADNYAKVIKSMQASVDGLKGEIDRLTAKKKAIENGIDRMKRNLEASMIATDKRKFKTDLFTFYIQKNQPSLVLDDDYPVPQEFLIEQDPKVDTKAIKERLLAGESFKFASLKESESIRIK